MRRAFRKVFDNEKERGIFFETTEDGHPRALTANFLAFSMSMLEKAKVYLKSAPEFFFMYKTLIKIDIDIVRFILNLEFIGRLTHLYFDDTLDEKEAAPLTEAPNHYQADTNLDYPDELIEDPDRYKEGDFYKKSITNLTNYFTLLWELLSYSVIKGRKNHSNFLYHRAGIDYELSELEAALLEFNKEQIDDLFDSIYLDNRPAIKAINKIIAFTNYENPKTSRAALKYISQEVEDDRNNKRYMAYIPLIKTLLKLNDSLQSKRVVSKFFFFY